MAKLISIVTPCFNEEDNVLEMHAAVREVFAGLPQYQYEHIFIDNCSRDRTQVQLRELAEKNSNVRVIFNTRNFGQIRSPYYGLLQADGDAVITLACDFQDPPTLIPDFLSRWEAGFKVVMGVKDSSDESRLMFAVRASFYRFVRRLSEIDLVKNATGFGLYDRSVIAALRAIHDPYPYFPGLIADLGFRRTTIVFHQRSRRRGLAKSNFYILYDRAMLGITNHSKVPLRLATMVGFLASSVSFCVAVAYLLAKLLFWRHFPVGTAPLLIGVFFFASVQLFFVGLLGEYIGSIHTQVLKRPLVIEAERLNFDSPANMSTSDAGQTKTTVASTAATPNPVDDSEHPLISSAPPANVTPIE